MIKPRWEQQQVLTHVPEVPKVLLLWPTLCNRDIPASFDVHQREPAGHVLTGWLVFGDEAARTKHSDVLSRLNRE